MGTNWSTGSSVWTWGRTSSLWGWRSPETGCSGRLWILLLWRYSRPAWTRFCAACSGWPCFGRRVGLDDPQRSLPTPNILWFCISCNHSEARWGEQHCGLRESPGWSWWTLLLAARQLFTQSSRVPRSDGLGPEPLLGGRPSRWLWLEV